jgi:hypothetical protein
MKKLWIILAIVVVIAAVFGRDLLTMHKIAVERREQEDAEERSTDRKMDTYSSMLMGSGAEPIDKAKYDTAQTRTFSRTPSYPALGSRAARSLK